MPQDESAQRLLSNDITHLEDGPSHEASEDYTTKQEVLGWCLYAWAAEPFIVSAVSTYVPILLEQFARENGVLLDDHSQPCVGSAIPQPPILPPDAGNMTTAAVNGAAAVLSTVQPQVKCVVYVLGQYIDTSSFALYTFSFSVLFQTLVVISMSGASDRGHYRKQLLIGFGVVGALSTVLFLFVSNKRYYVAALLAIISNSCFGAVNVCGNSYLPILVANSKEIRTSELLSPLEAGEHDVAPNASSPAIEKGIMISKLSGRGAASGYISAVLVQILSMLVVLKTGSSTKSIQYAIFLVGMWWLVFQVPLVFMLKSRPGPPLSVKPNENVVLQYVKYGWKTLFLSIKHAAALRDVCIFLLGWFILSDSVTTINSTAILFAKTELQMSTPKLVVIGMLSVLCAIAGSILIPFLQQYFKISAKTALFAIIIWTTFIPLYGIIGFFLKIVGLKHDFEMYILAVWYGFSMGGLATVTRSLFSLLIPKGKESTFFSLFSITDKGSSIIGPTVTGIITNKTHNIRYTFYFLFLLLLLSLPVFSALDLERGSVEAQQLEHMDDEVVTLE